MSGWRMSYNRTGRIVTTCGVGDWDCRVTSSLTSNSELAATPQLKTCLHQQPISVQLSMTSRLRHTITTVTQLVQLMTRTIALTVVLSD